MSKQRDSKKRIAFPIHLSEEGSGVSVPDVIQILPAGEWDHPYFGKFSIGTAEITKFCTNFSAGIRNRIPITEGHDNGMSGGELPAVAWFTNLEDRGMNGLWGGVEWTDEGKELLTSGAFKYFSAEIYMQYKDPETGEEKECVLVGGALTNKPYFKEMQPVMFSEDNTISQFHEAMDIKAILAKKQEELSSEEKTFLKEHKDELTDEQKTEYAAIVEDAPAETAEEKAAREEKEEGDRNEAAGLNRDGSAEVTASEKGVKVITLSEAEHKLLSEKANAGQTALDKIEASEREAFVGKLIFNSSTNKDGRFLPKEKTKLTEFVKGFSEAQRTAFAALIKEIPASDKFSEIGDGGAGDTTVTGVTKLVDDQVKALMASDSKLTYSSALTKLFKTKPDLKTQYEGALAENK